MYFPRGNCHGELHLSHSVSLLLSLLAARARKIVRGQAAHAPVRPRQECVTDYRFPSRFFLPCLKRRPFFLKRSRQPRFPLLSTRATDERKLSQKAASAPWALRNIRKSVGLTCRGAPAEHPEKGVNKKERRRRSLHLGGEREAETTGGDSGTVPVETHREGTGVYRYTCSYNRKQPFHGFTRIWECVLVLEEALHTEAPRLLGCLHRKREQDLTLSKVERLPTSCGTGSICLYRERHEFTRFRKLCFRPIEFLAPFPGATLSAVYVHLSLLTRLAHSHAFTLSDFSPSAAVSPPFRLMSAAPACSGDARLWLPAVPPAPSFLLSPSGPRCPRGSASLPPPSDVVTFRIPSIGPPPALHTKPPSLQVFETHFLSALQFLFLCERVLPPPSQDGFPPAVFSGSVPRQVASTFFSSLAPVTDRSVPAVSPLSPAVCLDPFSVATWEKHLPALRAHAETSLSARCSLVLAAAFATLTCERPREISSFVSIICSLLDPESDSGRGIVLKQEARRWLSAVGVETQTAGVSSPLSRVQRSTSTDPFVSFFAGFLSSALTTLLRTAPGVLPFYRSRITTHHLPLLLSLDRGGHWVSLLLTLLRYVYTLLLHPPTAVEASAAAAREAASASGARPEESQPAEGQSSGGLGSNAGAESRDISPTTHALTVLRFLRQQLDAVCGQPALAALSFFLCSRLLASATAGGSLQLVGREAEAVVCGVWGRREGRAAVCLLGGREVVRVMGELARLAAIRRSVWPSLLHAPDEHLLPLLMSRLGRRPLGDTGGRGNAGAAWREKRAREALLAGWGPQGAQRSSSMETAPYEDGEKRDWEEGPAASRERWGGVWEAAPSSSEKRRQSPCRNCGSLCWRQALGVLPRNARNRFGFSPFSVARSDSSAVHLSAPETARRLRPGEAHVSLSRSRGNSVDRTADLGAVSGTVSSERKRPQESSLPRGEGVTDPRLAAKRVRGEALGSAACTAERGGETPEGEKESSTEQARQGEVSPPPFSGVPRGGEHTPSDRTDSKLDRESFRAERAPHSGLCEACCRCLRKTRSEMRQTHESDADGPRLRPTNPVFLPWLLGEPEAVHGSPEPSSHALAVAETAQNDATTSMHPRASLLAWLLCLPPSFVLISLLLPPGLVRDLLFLLSQMQLLAPAPDEVASELELVGAPASRAVKKHVARRFLAQAAGASQQFFFEAFQHHWLLPPSVAKPLAAAAASGASGPLPQAFAMLAPFVGDLARFVVLLTPRFASVATIPEPTRLGAPGPGLGVSGRGWKPVGETEAGQRGEEGMLEKGAAPRGLQLCHFRLSSPSVVFARWLLSSVYINIPFPFSVVAAAHARLAFCLDWLCFLPPHLLPSSSRSAAVSPGAPAFHSLQEPQQTLLGNRVSPAEHAFDFAVWRTPAACLQAAERTENLLRIAVEHSRGTSARARAAASAAASATAIAQQEYRLLSAELRSRTVNGATDSWAGPGAPATQGPSGLFCEDTGRRERLAAAREAAKETVRRATAAGLPTVWASGTFPTHFLQEAVVLPLLQFLLPCRRQSAVGRACTQGGGRRRKKGAARGASEVSPQAGAPGLAYGLEGDMSQSTGHSDRMQGQGAACGQAARGDQGMSGEAEKRMAREDSRTASFSSLEEHAAAVYGLPGNLSRDAGSARLARLLPFGFLAFQLATDAAVLPRDAASLLDFFGCLLASYSPSSLPLFLPSLATALAAFGLLQLFLLPASPLAASLGKGRPQSAALTAAIQSHTLPGLLLRQAGFPVRLAYRSVPPRGDSSAPAFGRVSGAHTLSGGTGGPASLGAGLAPDRLVSAPQESPSPSDEEANSRESSQGRPEGLRVTRVFTDNPGPPAGRTRDLSASEGVWRPVLYLGGSGAQSDFKALVPLHQLLLHACVAAVAMVAQVASGAPAFRALGEICWRPARAPHRDTFGAPAGDLHAPNPEGKVDETRPRNATGGVRSGGEAETLEEEREAKEPGALVWGEKENAVESEDSQPFSSSGCSSASETDSSDFSQDEDDEALSDIFFRPAQDPALAVFLSRRASTPRPWPSGCHPSVSSVSSAPRSASDPRSQGSTCGSNRADAGDAEGEKKGNSERGMLGGSFYQLPAFLELQSGLATEGRVSRNLGAPRRPEQRRPRGALKPRSSLALLAVEATERGQPWGLMGACRRREKAEEESCLGRCLCRPSRWWRELLRPAENRRVSAFPSQRKASICPPSFWSLLASLIGRETAQEAELEASRAAKEIESTEERQETEERKGEQSVGMKKEGGEAGVAGGGERSSVASAERANERASTVWYVVGCVRQALESGRREAFEDLESGSEQPSGTACAVQRAALQQDARDETRQDKPLSYIAQLLLERVSKVSPVSEETLCGASSRGAKDPSAGVDCLQFSWLRGRGLSSEGDAHELSQRLCLLLSAVRRDLWRTREGPVSDCLFCGRLLGSKGAVALQGRRGSREGNAGEAEQRRFLENLESEETEGKEVKSRETQERSKAQCRGILGRTGDCEDALESSCWGASPKQETMYKDSLFVWGSLLAEMQRRQEETRGRGHLEREGQKGEVQEDTVETKDSPDPCPFVGFLLLCLLAQSAEAAAKAATVDSGCLQLCRVKTQKNEVEEEPINCAGGSEAGGGETPRESEEDGRGREQVYEAASLLRACLHLYGVYIHRRMRDLDVSNPREVVTRDLELGLPFLFFAQSQRSRRARHQPSQGPSLLMREAEASVQAEDNGVLPTPFALLCQCYHLPAHILPLFIGQVPLLSAVFVSSSVGELETLGVRCGLLRSVSEDRGEAPGVATSPGKRSLLPRLSSRPFCCGLCACMRAGERDARREERRLLRGEEPTLPARTYPIFTLPEWHDHFLERRKRRRGEENREPGVGFHSCKSPEVVKLVQRVLLPRTLFPPSVLQWRSCLLAWRLFGREMEIYHLLDAPTPSFLSRPVFRLSSSALAASESVGSESSTGLSNGSSLPGSGLLGSPVSPEGDSSPGEKLWDLREGRNALSGALPLWLCVEADGEGQGDGGERLVLPKTKSGEFFFTPENWPKEEVRGRVSSSFSPLFSSDPRQGSVSSLRASLVLLPPFAIPASVALCSPPSPLLLDLLDALLSLLSLSFSASSHSAPVASLHPQGAPVLLGCLMALLPLVSSLRPSFPVLRQTVWTLASAPDPRAAGESSQLREERSEDSVALLVTWLLSWLAADPARLRCMVALLKVQALPRLPPQRESTLSNGARGDRRSGGGETRARRGVEDSAKHRRSAENRERERRDERQRNEDEEREEARLKEVWNAEDQGHSVWQRATVQIAAFATRHAGPSSRDPSVLIVRLNLLRLFSFPERKSEKVAANVKVSEDSLHGGKGDACAEIPMADIQRFCEFLVSPGPSMPSSASPEQ
ncbi:hypothetical protein TGME49_221720 [Toxoplasma gondii ME49]|uniref:Tbc domain,related protein n=1 Tax=Toxoplasma gondii (strain ATCC 50611 / Me49) TaxID=508771 RepID=S8FB26_TOXGM|nr:hypothetical protein TGME49_221720 [Toxoplasma gondii ME49]EPT32012.1 hypothetical protein TGME49_221720 [Toxoplasma gondii ME49]|eukprot:XP_018638284.1 hypothetical protein TGME49_221720 [Toxoplasma gondii ME49]